MMKYVQRPMCGGNRGSRRGSSEPVQGVRPSGNPFYKVKAGGCGGSAGGCVYCTCNGAKPCLITSIFGRCLCAVSGMSCTRYDTSSGAINPSKYQESCRCRLETRIYFSIGNNCMQNSFDIRNGELYSYSNKFLPCAESSYPATSSAVTQHRTAKPSPRARTLLV